jgi:hypothetical protein
VIANKIGVSVFAGGLVTAGLVYWARSRGLHRSAAKNDLPTRFNEDGYKRKPHEVSAFVGAHALAPDREQMGDSLADPDLVEVPVGHTADRSYDWQLQQDKLPQPDTTGTILKTSTEWREPVIIEAAALEIPLEAQYDVTLQDLDGGVSARPTAHPHELSDPNEGYDALSPDDLGAQFLARATQSPRAEDEMEDDPWDRAEAREHLGSELEPLSEPIDVDVDVPRDVWDAPLPPEQRR